MTRINGRRKRGLATARDLHIANFGVEVKLGE